MLTYDNSHPGGLRARRRQVLASFGQDKESAIPRDGRRRIVYVITGLAAVVILLELVAVFVIRG
jgi:hypothetical protein